MYGKKFHGIRLNLVVAVASILASVLLSLLVAVFFYNRYSARLEEQVREELDQSTEQLSANLDTWIRNVMALSDALYYDVVLDADYREEDLSATFELLYSASRNSVEDIALFTQEGELILSAPSALQKENVDLTSQEWFSRTITESDSICFYAPHVQNLYQDEGSYKWTIAVARPVLLTADQAQTKGVLLVSLRYSELEQVMDVTEDGTVYLTDREGNLIYHPNKGLLGEEEREECRRTALAGHGLYVENGRYVSVTDIGYTGWILVNEREASLLDLTSARNRAFYVLLSLVFITLLVLVNLAAAYLVTNPFHHLQSAVEEIQRDNLDVKIEESQIREINSLGGALTDMAGRIQVLLQEIEEEHRKERKLEMDVLQSQINPHFIYNTLDLIVWSIENRKPKEAARIAVELARFFRLSLSKGKDIISVADEVEHAKSYLFIQSSKYDKTFSYQIEMEEGTGQLSTVKLILQPLVENSICHGIIHMEDEGEIRIRTRLVGDELQILVEDNGWGMLPEKAEQLLNGEAQAAEGHSGIGVNNVNQRIRLCYGDQYGLTIESEPDEGTTITVHLPVIPYEEEAPDEKD